MHHNKAPQAQLTTIARFPKNYFLEALTVRADNSVLITVLTTKELWYVPPANDDEEVLPLHIFTFEQIPMGIAELEPEIFLVLTSNAYTTHESFAYRLDLRDWRPGNIVKPELTADFRQRLAPLMAVALLRQE